VLRANWFPKKAKSSRESFFGSMSVQVFEKSIVRDIEHRLDFKSRDIPAVNDFLSSHKFSKRAKNRYSHRLHRHHHLRTTEKKALQNLTQIASEFERLCLLSLCNPFTKRIFNANQLDALIRNEEKLIAC
jgi:hypothetical protein